MSCEHGVMEVGIGSWLLSADRWEIYDSQVLGGGDMSLSSMGVIGA